MPFNNKRNSRDDRSNKPRNNAGANPSGGRGFKKRDTGTNTPFGSKRGDFSKSDAPFKKSNTSGESSGFGDGTRSRSFSGPRGGKPTGRPTGAGRWNDGKEGKSSSRTSSSSRWNDAREGKDNFRAPRGEGAYNKGNRSYKGQEEGVFPSKLRKRAASVKSSENEQDGLIRLNRYIANSGVCSRRKADELIAAGVVSVNGEVVTELGTRVDPAKDEIRYNGERLKREKMVYILLNKPKDYITTTDDPHERRTVMELVAKATKERIYPVGRLDRNTTGLLLLTNDGNLAEKLAHPRNNIRKIYHVELSKNLTQGDLNKIAFGLELEDGLIKPDEVSYVQGASKREVGIQIHSGKNRIVRRIFEHLGYEVVKLDRVIYANLTKKDLPRGRWRYLEEKEITQLKHLIH